MSKANIADLSKPAIEKLVEEIVSVNHAWKVACDLFDQNSALATSLRDLKTRLQVRLLRCHYPQVFLALDPNAEGELLYGVHLQQPLGIRDNAEHIPVRVAKEVFLAEELEQFINVN